MSTKDPFAACVETAVFSGDHHQSHSRITPFGSRFFRHALCVLQQDVDACPIDHPANVTSTRLAR
jgi:hypothetical protein